MSYVFGIDLGTTYSCIAYLDEYGKPVGLPNREGEHTTPSVVMIDGDTVTVGMEAKRMVEVEPEKTIQFIKRRMGKKDDTVTVDGRIYHAPEISAYILRRLVEDANSHLQQTGVLRQNEEVKDVVITCPAYFGEEERNATRKAGELAGLNVLDLINEPTAAAISYGISGAEKEETVLVYDLGGGTFDITVMNIKGKNISVVCTGGDADLGGKNWDEALQEYVIRRYEEEKGEDLSEDPEAVASLYLDAENWKKALTAPRGRVNMTVYGPRGKFHEELTREKFDDLTAYLLNQTKNELNEVLAVSEKKGYPLSRIDRVLLVGGSSRMPQVVQMLERDYHVEPQLADPAEAVAKGAAIYAVNRKAYIDFALEESRRRGISVERLVEDNLSSGDLDRRFALHSIDEPEETQIRISNVLSRTYGTDVLDSMSGRKKIVNMLMMNDSLPASSTTVFGTVVDNQAAMKFEIYESFSTEEYMPMEDRTPLTTIEMKFTKPVPAHTQVETTLALDNSGIIHLTAVEKLYGTRLDTTFQLANQMTEEETSTAIRRLSNATLA